METANMNELVSIENGKAVTTSLKIAEVFGRQHKNIIRAIENLKIPEEFGEGNFSLAEYEWENGLGRMVRDKMYLLTRDGTVLLAMSFTGPKAMEFKIAYLHAFNAMEAAKEIFPSPNMSGENNLGRNTSVRF